MASKKIFTKEVKIGIICIVSIALLFWGLNFLKGINLFTPTNHYYLQFEKVDGLVVSNNVMIQGYKVGQVRSINYNFNHHQPFIVDIALNSDIRLPQGTIAVLADESIMGGKMIDIRMNTNSSYHTSGDTLISSTDAGLIGALSEIVPTLSTTINHIDSLITSVDQLINTTDIDDAITDIRLTAQNLKNTTSSLNNVMNHRLPGIINNLDSSLTNINQVTAQLNKINFTDIVLSIDTTLNNLNQFTQRINDPNGTLGLLINDPQLYNQLTTTVSSANNLLIDLKQNPKRYVHFSLWGSKEKNKK